MTRRQFLRILASAGVFLLCSAAALTDEVRHLKLSEAVRLAIGQNRALKIARLKIQESEHSKEVTRSDYFPTITNQSNALHISELQNLSIPPGAFGSATGVPIPNVNTTLPQGKRTLISSGTMIAMGEPRSGWMSSTAPGRNRASTTPESFIRRRTPCSNRNRCVRPGRRSMPAVNRRPRKT